MTLALQLPTFLLGRDNWQAARGHRREGGVRHINLTEDQKAGIDPMVEALKDENPEHWLADARLRPLQRRFESGLNTEQWHALGAFEDGEVAALRIAGFPDLASGAASLEEPLGDWPAPRGWPVTAARIMVSLAAVDKDPLAFGSPANPRLCRHVNRWTRTPGIPLRVPAPLGWRTPGLSVAFDNAYDGRVTTPETIGLGCVRNPRGEPLSIMLLSDILDGLGRSEIEALQQPDFRFDIPGSNGDVGLAAKSPILTADGGDGFAIRFDQAGCRPDRRAPRSAQNALDALQAAIREAPAYRTVLQEGETLLVNNRMALCRLDTGRMSRRWLIRILGGPRA